MIKLDLPKASNTIQRIDNFLLYTTHGDNINVEERKLFTASATTILRKQGIIRRSRGNFARQKSRTSHLFFVVSK